MSHLKKEKIKKCTSLLRQFIDETRGGDGKKALALLALEQLRRITAGIGESSHNDFMCYSRPRAWG